METLTLYIKEKKQVHLLQEFLQHIDFVVLANSKNIKPKNKKYSILNSAGIWENRNIKQNDIRIKAWKQI